MATKKKATTKKAAAPKAKKAATKRKRTRPSPEEQEKKVEFVVRQLMAFKRKYEIKAAFRAEFGPQSARSIEDYLARARALLAEESERNRKELRGTILMRFAEATSVEDPKARLDALDRIVAMMGLRLPSDADLLKAESTEKELGPADTPSVVVNIGVRDMGKRQEGDDGGKGGDGAAEQ